MCRAFEEKTTIYIYFFKNEYSSVAKGLIKRVDKAELTSYNRLKTKADLIRFRVFVPFG